MEAAHAEDSAVAARTVEAVTEVATDTTADIITITTADITDLAQDAVITEDTMAEAAALAARLLCFSYPL